MGDPIEGFVPFPPEFAARYRRNGYWRGITLGDALDDWVRRHDRHIALVSGTERISYRQLGERVERLAVGLAAAGIGARDRVVVQLPNLPEFVYLSFALFKLGALPVMALPAHRETEIGYIASFSEARAYAGVANFRGFDYVRMLRTIAPRAPALKHLLIAGGDAPDGCLSIAAMLAGDPSPAERRQALARHRPSASDVAFFLLSGGTTGLPKLIPRTHDDYLCNTETSIGVSGLTPDSVYMVALPISHNFPLGSPGVFGTLATGATAVLAPSPSPEIAFPLIERERVTITAQVPAVTIQWLESPLKQKHDLSSLRVLQVGGSRLNAEVAQRVKPLLGATVQQVFGMAEGLVNYTRLDDPEEVLFNTQGRPMSDADEILVVGWDGNPAAPGEQGELLTRGPYTIRGYYKAPDHNARAFSPEGYYRTGDLVRIDPSGNISVEGRVKDLINRGGEKISAEEVENLILAHPAVQNVAVVAMPDAVMGERVCACAILRPGLTLALDDIRQFMETAGISRFKLPERLEILERLPLTTVGKISKKDLREDIAAKMRAEGKIA